MTELELRQLQINPQREHCIQKIFNVSLLDLHVFQFLLTTTQGHSRAILYHNQQWHKLFQGSLLLSLMYISSVQQHLLPILIFSLKMINFILQVTNAAET